MPRSVNSVAAKAKRKKVIKAAKGYFGRRKNVHTIAKNAVEKLLRQKNRASISEYQGNKGNVLINYLVDFINKELSQFFG